MNLVWEAVVLSCCGAILFFVSGQYFARARASRALEGWQSRFAGVRDQLEARQAELIQARGRVEKLEQQAEVQRRKQPAVEALTPPAPVIPPPVVTARPEQLPAVPQKLYREALEERDALRDERDRIHADRDALRNERNHLARLHGSLRAKRDALEGTLAKFNDALSRSRGHLDEERERRHKVSREFKNALDELNHDLLEARSSLEHQQQELKKQREEAVERDELEARVQELGSALRRAEREADDLRGDASAIEERVRANFESKIDKLSQAADLQRERHLSAQKELKQVRERTREFEAKADRAQALVLQVRRLESEIESLRNEPARRSAEEIAELEGREHEQRQAIRALEAKLRVSEEAASNVIELHDRLAEAESMLAQQADNDRELRRLQALELADKSRHGFTQVAESYAAAANDEQGEFGHRLDAAIRRVLTEGSFNTGVLSDSQGFTIWGVGDGGDHDDISAVAAESETLSIRARQLLPLSSIRELSFVDFNGVEVRSRFMDWNGEILSLTTIGAERRPDAQATQTADSTKIRVIMDELGTERLANGSASTPGSN